MPAAGTGGTSPGGPGAAGRVDVTVLSSGHHVADARLHRHCAALLRAGLRVEVLARGEVHDAPEGTVFRPLPGPTVTPGVLPALAVRGVRALSLPLLARGRVVLTLDPDLVPAARLRRALACGAGRRLVVDVHEDYAALLDDRPWATGAAGRLARWWARAATALSREADLTVVADDHVPPRTAARRLVVRNLPDWALLPAPPAEAPPPGPPRALYVGDVRASRGLFTMLRALERAPGWRLDVVGPVSAADEEELRRWTARSPAASRVCLHGRRPPRESWRLAERAWVGLSLLGDTPAFGRAVPSKVYDYLACGLPVLTTPLPRAAEVVTRAGCGRVVGSAEQAARLLERWGGGGAGRAEYRALRAAAVGWARRQRGPWTPYDELAAAVLSLLDRGGPAR
ncbi:glycosyltransferase [Allostreptomyces psammosilenae]|uniref:D-inositol 3-phosphate glycosyltransferase n=1 Tax=Allostreptomyces psammosilenae TaxID=1892865 RepID=A0A853ADG1_9ACTN|nr:glycosyltransferase [Allostreptomyces psammosilenae]NYI08478.1 glycosyltransferase involved in cell wall biosynthesis [Allostreptomyces psammosilenae]